MRIIGFNFTKVSAERIKDSVENLKINTEVDFHNIKQIKSDILKTKDEILEIKFFYKVKYEPGFAVISLEGKALVSADSKTVKEILKNWKKKTLPEQFRLPLVNTIMRKSSLRALSLEDELNLPLHIPMPSLKRNNQ